MNAFDLSILSFLNRFAHRSLSFDQAVVFLSDANLLKGGVIVGMIWWIWFDRENVQRKREALLAGLMACVPALVIVKILAKLMFRVRPLNELRLLSIVHYGMDNSNWKQLSSFPSDHAALFFTLALGIYFASRRAGWFCFIYSSLFICLPRVYLGEHYPTDIVAGAAIGMVPAWLANLPGIREPLTGWALRWMDSNPSQFYCFAFIVTYQVAELFDPALKLLRFVIFHRIG
jgi:undecaprenyl-diphosphatase